MRDKIDSLRSHHESITRNDGEIESKKDILNWPNKLQMQEILRLALRSFNEV